MKLLVNRFHDAIDYLAAFARDNEPINFTPHGALVRVSAAGQSAYAEVWLQTEEPLKERFAVQLHVIRRVVHELQDGELAYKIGAQSSWEQGTKRWWVPYFEVEDKRPDVQPERSTYWDGSFSALLRLMKTCTREAEHNASSLDCVRMSVTPYWRKMVATDGVGLVSYEAKANEDDTQFDSLMIDRSVIPLIEKTCESGMKVEISAGITSYSIKCGRRLAIFPLRQGEFPRWEDSVKPFKQARVIGSVEPEKHALRNVAKQSAIVCSSVILSTESDQLIVDAASEDAGFAEVGIPAVRKGQFGPLRLKADYLKRIAETWPAQALRLEFRGQECPLIIQSGETESKLYALIMPVKV